MENKQLKFSPKRFWIIFILVIVGIALCVELGYIFYKTNFFDTYVPSFCSTSELINCDGVARTEYSVLFGVPNALWGMFLYLVILFLLFVDRIQARFNNTIFDVFKNPRSYIAILSLLGFAVSIVLACISIFKIKMICYLCFCTYFVNLFIAITAVEKDFFLTDFKHTVVDFLTGAKKYFILFLIVLIGFISGLYYLDKTMIFSPRLKSERQDKEFFAEKNKYAIKGNILGKKNANVVVKIYSDYHCPFCRVTNIMAHKLAKETNVYIQEMNYPLDTTCNNKIGHTLVGHENSCLCSKYAIAAKKQEKFWGVANVLFEKRPLNEDELILFIQNAKLGIDIEQLKKDAYSDETADILQKEINEAANLSIYGTPAISINDVLYYGALPYNQFKERVQTAQKRFENEKNK